MGGSVGRLALCEQGPKLAPKGVFPILAGGSRSRGAQTGRLPHESRPLSTAHLLRPNAQPGSGWLTHSSGYSSNSSGPKMEVEDAHVEIPTSNYLFHRWNLDALQPPCSRDPAPPLLRAAQARMRSPTGPQLGVPNLLPPYNSQPLPARTHA